MSHRVPAVLLLPLLVGVSTACRAPGSGPPPGTPATVATPAPAPVAPPPGLQLAPIAPAWATSGAAAARPGVNTGPVVAVEIAVAPRTRLLQHLDLLGRKLPMGLGDLVMQSLAKGTADSLVPLDAELQAALAPDRASIVVLGHRSGHRSPLVTAALPFADARSAARIGARIGERLSERGGAVERRHPSGTPVWTGIQGDTLLLSGSYEALWSMGAQALAASRAPLAAADLLATIDIDALVTSRGRRGKDLATELGDELAKAPNDQDQDKEADAAAKGKSRRPARRPALTDQNREALRSLGRQLGLALAQAAHAQIAVSVSSDDGLVLSAVLEPIPGTQLARRAALTTPYALDATLPIPDDRRGVLAWGGLGALEPLLRAQLATAAGARAGAPAGADQGVVDGFLASFTGGGSCVNGIGDGPVSSMCSLPLRPGADARAALDRYARLVRAVITSPAIDRGRRFSSRVRQGVLEFDWPMDLSTLQPEQVATMRGYLGGDTIKYAAAVRGDRLLQFQGAAPRARLLAWRDPAPGTPAPARPPIVEDVLARTRGAALVCLVDPLAVTLDLLAYATDPGSRQARVMLSALPGLAKTRAPIVVSAPAGTRFAYELRIPMVTFDGVAELIAPFMGLMGK